MSMVYRHPNPELIWNKVKQEFKLVQRGAMSREEFAIVLRAAADKLEAKYETEQLPLMTLDQVKEHLAQNRGV